MEGLESKQATEAKGGIVKSKVIVSTNTIFLLKKALAHLSDGCLVPLEEQVSQERLLVFSIPDFF